MLCVPQRQLGRTRTDESVLSRVTMTVADASPAGDAFNLTWLHCNECHRSFEHHNRLATDGTEEGMRVLRSDLAFAFTSCGHVFCTTCIQQHSRRAFCAITPRPTQSDDRVVDD